MKMLGNDHKFTTPYHLQVNIFLSVALCAYAHGTGKWVIERFNRTLQNMLVKFFVVWSSNCTTCRPESIMLQCG